MTDSERYAKVVSMIKKIAAMILPSGSKVTLFGSRARGDARKDSDWDIHILVPGPEKLTFSMTRDYAYPFEEAGWEIDEEINPIVHTFSGWEKRKFLPLFHNIQKDGILL